MGAPARPEAAPQGPSRPVPVPPPPELPRAWHRRVARVLRFIVSHRLYTPRYAEMALRYLWLRLTRRSIRFEGFVFVERGAELYARRGYGRLTIGRWCWIGKGNALRCHEGNLHIGDKVVFGRTNTINCYLDIQIGSDCIFADWIYVCDFDHRYEDLAVPIRKQGIVKSPVRVGDDCWVGEKSTILRGVTIGDGSVIASHALVNRDIPPRSIVGGVPARVLKRRGDQPQRG